jgi:hypothetical protein
VIWPASRHRIESRASGNQLPLFRHHEVDIRDRSKVLELIQEITPHATIHTAAQPIIASFDIYKITNPAVQGADYQEGDQKNFLQY